MTFNNFIDVEYIDIDNFVFTFGIYKGIEYDDVRHDDPNYIIWCNDNIDWFNIDDEELEALSNEVNYQVDDISFDYQNDQY